MPIRRATAVDGDAIAYLLRDAFREYEPFYTRAGYAATTPDPSAVRERLKEGPTWVAEEAGSVIGTVSGLLLDVDLYLRSMAVTPAARGRRIGRALFATAYNLAVERRARRIYLSTTPFLFSAIRFYESLDFRRTGEPPDDLFGTPLFTMAKAMPGVSTTSLR
jgi:N-acetylglutamate synthase-like GNAT family acetyltransferase